MLTTDGERLLLGHATASPRWDIPKGLAEPGETARAAAVRELREETGLHAPEVELRDLGRHAYLPGKDLHLFAWHPPALPDPATLHCSSTFVSRTGATLPEFDRFALAGWDEALGRVGKNMARVLSAVRAALGNSLAARIDPAGLKSQNGAIS